MVAMTQDLATTQHPVISNACERSRDLLRQSTTSNPVSV